MLTRQDILNELCLHFDKIKILMDKYPNAIQILNNEENGCHLVVNIDFIEILPEEEHQG